MNVEGYNKTMEMRAKIQPTDGIIQELFDRYPLTKSASA
jgi:hypothetical protein